MTPRNLNLKMVAQVAVHMGDKCIRREFLHHFVSELQALLSHTGRQEYNFDLRAYKRVSYRRVALSETNITTKFHCCAQS